MQFHIYCPTLQVMHRLGRVEVNLNIVDGQEGNVEIIPQLPGPVNDGKWHRVKIQRKRMETIVTVDGIRSSAFSFGSDFHFGSDATNS